MLNGSPGFAVETDLVKLQHILDKSHATLALLQCKTAVLLGEDALEDALSRPSYGERPRFASSGDAGVATLEGLMDSVDWSVGSSTRAPAELVLEPPKWEEATVSWASELHPRVTNWPTAGPRRGPLVDAFGISPSPEVTRVESGRPALESLLDHLAGQYDPKDALTDVPSPPVAAAASAPSPATPLLARCPPPWGDERGPVGMGNDGGDTTWHTGPGGFPMLSPCETALALARAELRGMHAASRSQTSGAQLAVEGVTGAVVTFCRSCLETRSPPGTGGWGDAVRSPAAPVRWSPTSPVPAFNARR